MLICHIKDYFKINGKQRIQMPRKRKYVRFKIYERKIKSPFLIYEYFESILTPKDNGKQNPDESYTNKQKKHVACCCLSHTWVKILSTVLLIV